MVPTSVELSERIRLQLNNIEETDAQGNERRFLWQLFSFVGGSLLASSSDKNDVILGRALCDGAIASFAELIRLKLGRWLRANVN